MGIFRITLFSLLVLSQVVEAAEPEKGQPNPQAIKELASGKRKVASASW